MEQEGLKKGRHFVPVWADVRRMSHFGGRVWFTKCIFFNKIFLFFL